ncbi:MAG TPA: apolipoprotein N-acyltransferase [Magnetovibrio sp.]
MAMLDQVRRLQARVQSLGRWPGRALAFVLGFVAVFSMPPLYQVYVLVPAFSGLLWLIVAQPNRWRAFTVGWWFGAGFFTAGLYWVSFALLVDAEKFAWLVPFAVLGFAFGLGLFCAVLAWAVHATPGDSLTAKALVLAVVWTLLEWTRTWLFTGFPWNPLGSTWVFSDTLAQGASLVGTLGLSLLAVLVAVTPATLAGRGRSGSWLLLFVGGLMLALAAGGQHRLANATMDIVPDVRLRLVQANIQQADKWDPEQRLHHMKAQLDLSTQPPLAGDPLPTHVIWGETAAPFFVANHDAWMGRIADAAPRGGLMILGAPRLVGGDQASGFEVANSLLAIDQNAVVRATYDKFHLVPFGEYVPLSQWLPLERITQGAGAFTPGPGPQTLDLPGLPPVSPLICYEIIFPDQVTDGTGRAQWLLNLTNDAWYGKTAGPHQHFVSARLRAIEQGVPVVRVAGTGISGIVDAYGRVQASLALGEKAFIDGNLPKPAARLSLYARWGDLPVLLVCFSFLAAGLGLQRLIRRV